MCQTELDDVVSGGHCNACMYCSYCKYKLDLDDDDLYGRYCDSDCEYQSLAAEAVAETAASAGELQRLLKLQQDLQARITTLQKAVDVTSTK
jgi:hypothetical protein